jgi:Delta14-sterol reductase
MAFVNISQFLYIAHAVHFEPSILTTMDITTEGFGFMLSYGDLAWVPFIFSTQSKYLVERGQELPLPGILAAAALGAVGYYIFQGANSQKDQFRTDPYHPSVVHLQTLATARGTRLICSGWWGLARHINYTGDWLIGLSWCLVCGFGCLVPYVYSLYFAVLLIHRERRDDRSCCRKYGEDWGKYCARVPYRLIPCVY